MIAELYNRINILLVLPSWAWPLGSTSQHESLEYSLSIPGSVLSVNLDPSAARGRSQLDDERRDDARSQSFVVANQIKQNDFDNENKFRKRHRLRVYRHLKGMKNLRIIFANIFL
jgi:hypothetical protein